MKANFRTIVALILSASLGISIESGFAATPDSVAHTLEKQRATYERNMETLRADIQKKFLGELNGALKDLDKAKSVGAEQDVFVADGKLPQGLPFEPFTHRYAVLAKNMNSAYATAITSYRKASTRTPADEVQADADHFGKNWDLVPWKELIAQTGKTHKATSASAGSPLTVNLDLTGEYRIEIQGKQTPATRAASVTIPIPDGRSVTMPVIVSSHGDIHVVLTVYKDYISADLGVQRPVNLPAPSSDPPTVAGQPVGSLVIDTDSDDAIGSVRVKRIVDGIPPEIQNSVVEQESQPAQVNGANAFTVGSTWSGSLSRAAQNQGTKTATSKVMSVKGNEVVLRTTVSGAAADWVLTVIGSNLSVIEVRQVPIINGGVRDVHVSGTTKDGSLTLSGNWVWWDHGGSHAQSGTLTLTRD